MRAMDTSNIDLSLEAEIGKQRRLVDHALPRRMSMYYVFPMSAVRVSRDVALDATRAGR